MPDKPKKPQEPPKPNDAARLRSRAQDQSKPIPQEIRNTLLDEANKKEHEAYEKTKKYAKGGSVRGYGAAVKGRGRGRVC